MNYFMHVILMQQDFIIKNGIMKQPQNERFCDDLRKMAAYIFFFFIFCCILVVCLVRS